MALSEQDKRILNDILSASLKSPKGIDRARFRADNAEFIPELDQLERLGYLEQRDDSYYINILALAYLAKENPNAQSIVQNCGFVFTLLQANYRENLGKQILVPEIERATGLSADDVELALRFIKQASVLGSYSKVFVAPSESILKYKSFEDILKEQEEAENQNIQPHKAVIADTKSTKHLIEHQEAIESPLQLLDALQLHPRIIRTSKSLFSSGHYAEAIFAAFKAVNNFTKRKTGQSLDGKDLMAKAFNESKPIIKINKLTTQSERDEQEGFRFLFMGAMVGIRNPKAHDDTRQIDYHKALEYLAFASLLMRRATEGKLEPKINE
jgi:uncharacterized protein (TIGR02391 family)